MRVCDVEKWAVGHLPLVLRRSKLMSLVKVAVGPVGRVMTLVGRYADAVRYDIAHTTQVCSLRSMLNDRLDADMRRIEIADAPLANEECFFYERKESKPTMVDNTSCVLVPARRYPLERELNFVVRVPASWRESEKATRLTALVDCGKLTTMRYRIEYVKR